MCVFMCDVGVKECVCVCSRKNRQLGIRIGFAPGNRAEVSHRAYMPDCSE